MNQLLEVMLAIFAAKIVSFMVVLTYLVTTLVEPRRPRQRIFRKKAATGTPLGEIAWEPQLMPTRPAHPIGPQSHPHALVSLSRRRVRPTPMSSMLARQAGESS